MNILRKTQFFGNHRGRIVVAGNQVNRNTLIVQSCHLSPKKEAGAVIFPISIIEISGNNQKIDMLINGQLD